jgi:hypothetical protein
MPQFEAYPAGQEVHADPAEKTAERPITPESSPSQQVAPPVPLPPVQSVPDPTGPQAITSDGVAQQPVSRPTTDIDKIDKEWVDRAKAIIAQTKGDPFVQKNEVSKVKAAYIEKRFNKKLKVDDAKV